ncbi:MAG: phosphate acyltransferase PlsX, partial [Kofleriaceae bacterium]
MHRIVVDAMGGDHAPDEIVQGAAEASLQLASAEIILVGDAAVLGRLLPRMRHDGARVRVHHAPTFIEMDEKPAEALAAKPEASIAVAADLVARGDGDALVSAGNTGASVLACARRWTLLEGVRRAALAAVYPTELRRGEKDDPFSLILDVGATIDATAEDLVGFAVMGSAYAKLVSSNRRPRVALLSNGTESAK